MVRPIGLVAQRRPSRPALRHHRVLSSDRHQHPQDDPRHQLACRRHPIRRSLQDHQPLLDQCPPDPDDQSADRSGSLLDPRVVDHLICLSADRRADPRTTTAKISPSSEPLQNPRFGAATAQKSAGSAVRRIGSVVHQCSCVSYPAGAAAKPRVRRDSSKFAANCSSTLTNSANTFVRTRSSIFER